MEEYERFCPDFISVSFSAGDPQITVESNIKEPEVLDNKLNLILTRILDIACIVKRNDWDNFHEERKKAVKQFEKEMKALDKKGVSKDGK